MRLSDFKGEEAIDVLADIIEPLTMIIADEDIQKLQKEDQKIREESKGKNKLARIKFVKPALKNHKREVIEILARLENKPVEVYEKEITLIDLPIKVLEFINEPQIKQLFHSQAQAEVNSLPHSGSAMEITEAEGN